MYSLGKYVICVFSLFIFWNCTNFHKICKVESEQNNISKKQILSGITRIPPNTCRVEATVVELDSLEFIPYSKKPCEIAPCSGIIRINSVIGYGSDFGTPLNLNDKCLKSISRLIFEKFFSIYVQNCCNFVQFNP